MTDSTPVSDGEKAESQVDRFARLSEALHSGESIVPPVLLTGQARRAHIRRTLREDHANRIEQQASGTAEKFDALAKDVFKFFRGTALLFYRDMVGQDGQMPTVLALGDVHPSNFGVMPDAHGAPLFGVNDFDETAYAPFTWDIKRGAVGFWIAAEMIGGAKPGQRRRVVRHFIKGYLTAMARYARHETEKTDSYRPDNAPKVIRRLFKQARTARKTWLRDDYLKPNGLGFRSDDELQPISGRIATFQTAIDDLAKANGLDVPDRAPGLRVKDVCVRHGQGTASLGLPRYYVLLEGPSGDASDDMIIEFKRARHSALKGLTPRSDFNAGDAADRIAHGQAVQLAHGDVFFGAVTIDGESFMSRERAPFRHDIDLDDLSKKTWRKYAAVCGAALAHAHALSDDLGQVDYDVEPSILAAATPRDLFVSDILHWTEEAAARLHRDHALFCKDHALQAFTKIDRIYR